MSVAVKSGTSAGATEEANAGQGAGEGGSNKEVEAAGQSTSESDAGESGDPDGAAWDEKTKAYIAKLRKEAADNRTKAKDLKSKLSASEEQKKAILKAAGIETEDSDPTEQLQKSQEQTQQLLLRTALLETAFEHGIPASNREYFEFLMTKELEKLGDDDELSDEALTAVVAKAKAAGGTGSANTSVGKGKGKGNDAPPPGEAGGVTLDQFCKMTIGEKGQLWHKNPDLYTKLRDEAKAKNRFV